MNKIEPNSVALSFWSPPYFVGKEYEKDATFDSWQQLLKSVIEHHYNALKPGGFLVINIDDILAFADENIPKIQAPNKSKLRCKVTREDVLEVMAEHPTFNRKKIAEVLGCSEQTVDRRLNGNNIRGGKYKTQTRVKLVGHYLEKYAYDAGLYLYDRRIWLKDPTWQNSQWHSSSYRAVSEFEHLYFFWKPGETVIDRNRLNAGEWAEWGSRGVWQIASVRSNRDHEAQFPIELAEKVIRLLTESGDVVLDPFMGSGTTAIAAIKNNRNYIGIEREEKYVNLAKQRISEAQKQISLF
ncbi:site-specific DNA-methyltransferase [Vibrio parahaemolyticus]|nr:site-specific DNA-methyltransferase [Vibrio parahaemolyticus]EGQ8291904.1 site-specific DNA-methyltransferase [Vibrio parahaemolyticus]EGQ8330228.1 site-specific DNA-methyltransferase [Vibrio parahaemolyticus]EGQ8354134.1 site-specific DNA-methyltransferase [Vibrio parahaemolyticus]EGQ8779113.1 site-specific DNA-methyltransferase [Vibrio parahaemolyticus]